MTYINLTEAASEIGITPTSLYKIVNHEDPSKRLEPVNRTTHRGDGGYRFRISDVLAFKERYVKKDLTSMEAARRIGRSTTFIHKLIRDGLINYYEDEYRGKRTYFITETDLAEYTTANPDAGKTETIYDKRSGLFLFQPFTKDGVLARVSELKRISNRKVEATLTIGPNQQLKHEEALTQGWAPVLRISERKATNGYGYARFEFPIPTAADSVVYAIIEDFYKHAGPANMKINRTVGKILVEVRKCVLVGIMPATQPDFIDKLKLFLKSGKVIPKYDGTLIDTGLSPVTFFLTEGQKKQLQMNALQEGLSMQEYIEGRLGLTNADSEENYGL